MALADFKFDFMGYRKAAGIVSGTLVLLAVLSLAINQVE